MRITSRDAILAGLTTLLIAALACFVLTRDTGSAPARKSVADVQPPKLVVQSPLETARLLIPVASTAQEQKLASEAYRIADQEVDLAFASALQVTDLHPPVENSTTKDINARIQHMEDRLQSVVESEGRLKTQIANPHNKDDDALRQQLELAQARETLLKDALDDTREDLVRAGGDPQAEIKRELEEHEAMSHGSQPASPGKSASFSVASSLLSQFRSWRQLRDGYNRLLAAQQQAETYVATLTHKHEALAKGIVDVLGSDTEPSDEENPPPVEQAQQNAQVSKLTALSNNSRLLAQYDKRIQAEQQLATIYGEWSNVVSQQIRAEMHGMLRSVLLILLALIGIVLAEGFVERFYIKLGPDRRRLGTMRLVLRFVSQMIGGLVILLVLFGLPSQLSTVLALGAAGLTVALKDFIVAFFGWFVLMGRNGIRAGDWVEINGIGGEVVEVGLLRTILLETGNWNDAGHPTGRKVSFVNSYAIEGHYFNFTTVGQWLWDELNVLIPAGEDPYFLTNSVLKLVSEQTQTDATNAEMEWRKVAKHTAIQSFSAAPAIDVRPTNLGVNLVVRYVVNAHNRYEVRTRLYQAIVELLHGRSSNSENKEQFANPTSLTKKL